MAELGSRLWGGGESDLAGSGEAVGWWKGEHGPYWVTETTHGGGVAAGRGWARTLSPPGLAESPPPPSPG